MTIDVQIATFNTYPLPGSADYPLDKILRFFPYVLIEKEDGDISSFRRSYMEEPLSAEGDAQSIDEFTHHDTVSLLQSWSHRTGRNFIELSDESGNEESQGSGWYNRLY